MIFHDIKERSRGAKRGREEEEEEEVSYAAADKFVIFERRTLLTLSRWM